MKHHPSFLLSLLAAACLPLPAMAETKSSTSDGNASADARAGGTATGNGTKTATQKQTITVTSDGKTTIKKTVTVRDGKEETTTETIDENGKTTVDRGDGCNDKNTKDPAAGQDNGPWLGLGVKEMPAAMRDQLDLAEDEGVLVATVAPDGPAAKAGLLVNDLLLKLADRKLATPQDLQDALKEHKAGETVAIEMLRKGKRSTVQVTLTEPPADEGCNEAVENDPDAGGAEGERANGAAGFDAILNNPDVPEDFKKTVREMRRKMLEFEKQHQPK